MAGCRRGATAGRVAAALAVALAALALLAPVAAGAGAATPDLSGTGVTTAELAGANAATPGLAAVGATTPELASAATPTVSGAVDAASADTAGAAQPTTDSTVTRIAVAENGTGTWEVQIRTRLTSDADVRDYERFQAEFRENTSRYLDSFRRSMRGVVAEAANETGRSMTATDFTAETSIQAVPRRWGIVTYEFAWTNFAAREDDALVVGDVFRGQFLLAENDSMALTAPDEYVVAAAEPEPGSESSDRVGWTGRRAFAEDRPFVRFEPRSTPTATETPEPTPTPTATPETAEPGSPDGSTTTDGDPDASTEGGPGASTDGDGTAGSPGPDGGSTDAGTASSTDGPPGGDGPGDDGSGDDGPGLPLLTLLAVPLVLVALGAYRYYGRDGTDSGAGPAAPSPGTDSPGPGDGSAAGGAASDETVDGGGPTGETGDDAAASDGATGGAAGSGAAAAGAGAAAADDDTDGASPPVDPEPILTDADRVRNLLEERGGQLHQSEIVDALDWSKSKTSRVLSDMADDDAVEKLRIGRQNVIRLPETSLGAGESGGSPDGSDEAE